MNRSARVSLVGVAMVALAACGGGSDSPPVEAIQITTSAIETGSPIDVGHSADPESGAFAPEDWPSACDLVGEVTLRSILPQAEQVARRPSPRQIDLLSFLPGSEPPSQTLTIPEADCITTVGFPQEGLGIDDGDVVLQLTSSVPVAGQEEFVDLNTKAHMTGEPSDIAGGVCTFISPGTYNCDAGKMIFSISIDMRQTAQYTGANTSDYVVDGEEFSFRGADPQWDSVVHDKVLKPIVEAAVERTAGEAT